MSSEVLFKFDLMEIVHIKPLRNVTGTIMARCDRGHYIDYRVYYWWDGKHMDEYLLESDLEHYTARAKHEW